MSGIEFDHDSENAELSEAELIRLKRRDREHAALLSSARALVHIGDVDTLIRELVDRAYELIGSDLAYLSSYDVDTGNLSVMASRGSASQDLKTLTVPAGYGLAAKIVETQTPQWSNTYSRGPHALDASVSAAVNAEGIESLLGVPLLAGGQVLGALFAAYRYGHEFNADEISLLTALADHAAIVLHRAQIVSALEDAAARATHAKESAEMHARQIERGASIHEALTNQVLNGDDIESVCATLASSLQRDVAVARPDSTYIAGSNQVWWTSEGRLKQGLYDALNESAGTGRAVSVSEENPGVVVCTAVAAGAPIITLIADAQDTGSSHELRIIERASQLIALLVMQEETQIRAEEALRVELVGDLVSGGTSLESLRRRAKTLGHSLAARYMPVIMSLDDRERNAMRRTVSAASSEVLVSDSEAGLIILIPDETTSLTVAGLRRIFSNSNPRAPLSVYGESVVASELPEATEKISHLIEVLPRLGINNGIHASIEFVPYLALFGENSEHAGEFVNSMIGSLLNRDSNKNSGLTSTLLAYLDSNSSQVRTAKALHIHVNTVKQRLAAISRVLGDNWATPDKAFRLHVALRLHFAADG